MAGRGVDHLHQPAVSQHRNQARAAKVPLAANQQLGQRAVNLPATTGMKEGKLFCDTTDSQLTAETSLMPFFLSVGLGILVRLVVVDPESHLGGAEVKVARAQRVCGPHGATANHGPVLLLKAVNLPHL